MYEYITVYPVEGHFGCYQFFTITNIAAVKFMYLFLHEHNYFSKTVILNQVRFWPQGDIWQYQKTLLIVTTREEFSIGIRTADEYPRIHRTVHTKKNLVQNVRNAKVENLCSRINAQECDCCVIYECI